MNKGMFYLLPFLALTQAAASNTLTQIEVAALMNVSAIESDNVVKKPVSLDALVKPIVGSAANGTSVVVVDKPRHGRNKPRRMGNRLLKKRK